MDINKRAGYLGSMLTKHAAETPQRNSQFPKSQLFPKLTGPNKPPVLTNKSQAKVLPGNASTPSLPQIKVKGISPKFKPKMNAANPYNKTV